MREEGSVKLLGYDERGRGRYLVRVYVRTERNGRRLYKSKTIVGTERQAQQLKRKMLAERDAGTLEIESTHETFNDFLNRWLGTHTTAVRKRTNENDADMIRLYVHDTIGKIKLSKLHVLDIQELYAVLLNRSNKKPLSAATVRRLHAVIHHALEDAVRWELIPTNPADRVTLPAAKSKPVEALDRNQINRFLAACDMDRLGIILKFLLWTGVRPSEALGLKWTDIDWSRNSATIMRTLHHNRKGGGYRIEEAGKTKGSLRTIVIPSNLMADLRLWKAEQDQNIMRKGSKYNRLGLVFAQDNGEPIRQDNLVSRISSLSRSLLHFHIPLGCMAYVTHMQLPLYEPVFPQRL